jgi:hypothetical protein
MEYGILLCVGDVISTGRRVIALADVVRVELRFTFIVCGGVC